MTKEYCGFVCADVVDKAKEIRKEIDDFAKYNPNEAKAVKRNVLAALGVDLDKLVDDIWDFIPKLEGDTTKDRILLSAINMVVKESVDVMETRPFTNEELGITLTDEERYKKLAKIGWAGEAERKRVLEEEKRPPNEVICPYCRGGPITVHSSTWRCEQCGKSDYL